MPDLTTLLPFFEPIDAATPDIRFDKKFVLHEDIALLMRDIACVISGEKGSGKTALCLHLEKTLASEGVLVAGISFNNLRYASITHYIADLAHLSGIDALSLTSAFWRCVIMISAMRIAFERDKSNLSLIETRLVTFLRETKHIDNSPLDIFLYLVKAVWKIIEVITEPSSKAAVAVAGALPPTRRGVSIDERQMKYLRQYPFSDRQYQQAEKDFAEYLITKHLKVIIYLDGFDKLRGDTADDSAALNLLFYALIDAVYDITLDPKLSAHVSIKALIPHDRWLIQKPRDRDKWRGIHQSIVWRYANLKEFVRKRLALHPNIHSTTDFTVAWTQYFPEKIWNHCYKVNEDGFDYILRHTQYRPRQLQFHLIKLCKHFKDREISPLEIADVIASSCKERVVDFIEEFRIDHPQMDKFLRRFHGCANVLTYEAFCTRVGDILRQLGVAVDIPEKIEKLYHIGFVGRVCVMTDFAYEAKKHATYFPPSRVDGKRYKCEFYYEEGAPEEFRNLDKADTVCIHPMFHDYCGLEPNERYLIG